MKFSIVIPTMWRSDCIDTMLPIYENSPFVGEIIVIDNDTQRTPTFKNFTKIVYLPQKENIYVNPAWNLGASLARYEIILANDDILFNDNQFNKILNIISKSDYDIIGLSLSNDKKGLRLENLFDNPCPYQNYGSFMYIKKYVYIPENFLVYAGDDIQYLNSKKRGILIDTGVNTKRSETIKKINIKDIAKKDRTQFVQMIARNNKLNILIRTSNRPNYFKNCIDSIRKFMPDAKIHITIDDKIDIEYIKSITYNFDCNYYFINRDVVKNICKKIPIIRKSFIYNYYFNIIKPFLSGWCMILDDDDELLRTPKFNTDIKTISLYKADVGHKIVPSIENWGRNVVLKDISSLCVIWHSSVMVDWTPQRGGDYFFINELSKNNKIQWYNDILSKSQSGGHNGNRQDLIINEIPIIESRIKKIVIVVPCWGRADIFRIFCRQMDLFCQTDKADISCLYILSEEDAELKKLLNIIKKSKHQSRHIFFSNEKLGAKLNAGFRDALKDNPDYIMNCDSDDLLHPRLINYFLPYMNVMTPVFGLNSVVFFQDKDNIIHSIDYNHPFMVGCGRMFSQDVIRDCFNKYNGIYTPHYNRILNADSETKIKMCGYDAILIDTSENPMCLDIKTTENINSFKRITKKSCYKNKIDKIEYGECLKLFPVLKLITPTKTN
jgi:hypothetical protein